MNGRRGLSRGIPYKARQFAHSGLIDYCQAQYGRLHHLRRITRKITSLEYPFDERRKCSLNGRVALQQKIRA